MNPADVLNSGYGVQVNTSGKRFMDEHAGRKIKSDALFNVIGKDENYPIAIASEEIVKAINPSFVKLPIEMGTVKKFNTLEELATTSRSIRLRSSNRLNASTASSPSRKTRNSTVS